MHETIVGHGSQDHHSTCYKIQVAKMGSYITTIGRYLKTNPVTAEEYLRNEA